METRAAERDAVPRQRARHSSRIRWSRSRLSSNAFLRSSGSDLNHSSVSSAVTASGRNFSPAATPLCDLTLEMPRMGPSVGGYQSWKRA